ncbi:MAG TPA: SUMF1/EgtB/PvdO family nonheme iron enzyme [Burkholderiales bacterium]|nr:SUMF1/EgtB/PvdO family nonheme iron enzyme [Burkholderiales bacterium]
MRIFLSYPSQDRERVEPIYLALRAQGHAVFFDRTDLPPGEEYDIRIRTAIERSDLFVFIVSPDALDAGSYTLTELEIAEKTWELPAGRVLPVVLRPVAKDRIPPYLEAVTLLEPDGDAAATVADVVYRLALARRRGLLARGATALAAAVLVGIGTYWWWTHRGPAQETIGNDGAPARMIPAGAFTMGDDEQSPRREVYLDAYYLDKYEVTTARYAKFLQATGLVRPPEYWQEVDQRRGGDLPVVGIDWGDARAYCRWAGRRLPTEAEWEKAARGADGRAYPWGNDDPSSARAHYAQNATAAYKDGLAPVGSHEAGKSPYGVHDLAGNVAEWVADWYAEGFSRSDVRNPKGPRNGEAKVIRGGGWRDPAERIKSARRTYASADNLADDIGFRCARDFR